jgi:predicted  nucleic acid-binding Zn-ribbon protein
LKWPKIFLIVSEGPRRKASTPFPDADHAVVEGKCPACGCDDFKVAGTGRRPSSDDRAWEADGVALCCRAHVGTIRVETNTLFGVREDEAVLRGRCRVY